MRLLRRALALLMAASALGAAGCLPITPKPQLEPSASDYPQVAEGMSVPELESALHDRTYWRYAEANTHAWVPYEGMARAERALTHKFTAVDESGREVLCVVSQVLVRSPFYFVFVDGRLDRIVEPSSLRAERGLNKEEVTRLYARQIIEDPGLPPSALAAEIEKRIPEENRGRRGEEPPPIALIWPFVIEPDIRKQARFLERHDAIPVHLGATPESVRKRFGAPVSKDQLSSTRAVWTYDAYPGDTNYAPCRVLLEFEADRLTASYTMSPVQ